MKNVCASNWIEPTRRNNVNIRTYALLALGLAVWLAGCAPGKTAARQAASGPAGISPALIGTKVPDLTLYAPDGKQHSLNGMLAQKPTVLVVYRGNWCVYCQKQLADLQKIEPELLALGYQIVAISPDSPDELRKTIEGRNLKYQLMSDMQMRAATVLGIAYNVDPEVRRELALEGFSARNVSAQPDWALPVPAVFIIGTDGVIHWEYVNPDYRQRVPPDLLLAAAKAFAAPK
jgi:peroxiredoxin